MSHVEEVSLGKSKTAGQRHTFTIDCIFFYYLLREFKSSAIYRISFLSKYGACQFTFILLPTRYDLIDYKWNNRVTEMVQERCEIDHALSWLSTLGGAFSALGDYYESCAEIAGKISINQLKLALRLRDPMVACRCRLYFSLSLIQQQKFKLAKRIILEEYKCAQEALVLDERLLKMCKGIWSKLQYEHSVHRCQARKKKSILTLK